MIKKIAVILSFIMIFAVVAPTVEAAVLCSHAVDGAASHCLDQQVWDQQGQDQDDHAQCSDCCCQHTHSMTKLFSDSLETLAPKGDAAFASYSPPYSRDSSPLYRPPIA